MRFRKVFCNVRAYVSCRGYVGIPLSARGRAREDKVAPRISFYSSLTEATALSRTFFIAPLTEKPEAFLPGGHCHEHYAQPE